MRKNRRGITLITLVITIIVLLILATVSISLVVGDNGIISKAKNAKTKTRNVDEKEKVELAVASAKVLREGELTEENLNAELERYFEGGVLTKIENEDSNETDIEVIELPDGFQQVEYIESTGTQYIETKIKPNDNTKVIIKFELENMQDDANVFTADWSSTGFAMITIGGNFRWHNTGNMTNLDFSVKNHEIYVMEVFKNTVIINNRQVLNNSYTSNSQSTPIKLFGYLNKTHMNKYKLFYFDCYENDKLVNNFIPCYSTTTVTDVDGIEQSKDTIGLYDTVEGKFYTNQGTGEFSKGKDIKEKTEELNGWIYEINNRKYTISSDGRISVREESTIIANFDPEIEKVNGTYIKVKVPDEVQEKSQLFQYIITNEEEVEKTIEISDTEYVFLDLDLDTEYKIKVIAIDEEGNEKISNEIQQSTTNKLYLYYYGEEYEEITGGWEIKNNESRGRSQKNSDNILLYYSAMQNTQSECTTKNLINVSDYNKAFIKYKKTNSSGANYGRIRLQETWSTNNKNGDYLELFDISSTQNIYFSIYNWDSYDYIYEVYLEL